VGKFAEGVRPAFADPLGNCFLAGSDSIKPLPQNDKRPGVFSPGLNLLVTVASTARYNGSLVKSSNSSRVAQLAGVCEAHKQKDEA
jgi:hypothetical protein